ncbi:GntR family transcriptional regulator [Massilistercora timonensis]|uniref:GntR family transcriptional regulator n=1 Tax=Massilistercora timonensis TaxID=2086584 RepID=UPI003AB3BBD2
MPLTQIGNKKSLSERAYESIKDAIVTGEFQPGQILTEEQLAGELAISRTPVRTAVKQLEYEGLVEVNPSRNIIVAKITEKDIQDAVEARRLVEVEVAGMVAKTADEDQCRELREIVRLQEKSFQEQKTAELIEYECLFHTRIGQFCGNIWFEKLITSISLLQKRVLILGGKLENNWEQAFQEHRNIIDLMESHQEDQVRKLMSVHIQHGQPVLKI